MRQWPVCLCFVWLFCQPLYGQKRNGQIVGKTPVCTEMPESRTDLPCINWYPQRCARRTPQYTAANVIWVRDVSHKRPKAAVKEFQRGVQARQKGQNDEAFLHLKEAIRLDPNFAEAQAELGVAYAKTGQAEQALDQYELALTLQPNFALVDSNKAAALVMLSRWEDAEQAARRALHLDSCLIEAHYMLGIALLEQGKITPETAAHLAVALDSYPRAREYLASVEAVMRP